LVKEARDALRQQGFTVIEPVLYQRAAYSHAVIDGRSVHEYEPDGKAAGEIDALFACMRRTLSL
jgi:chromosome partitioning protein